MNTLTTVDFEDQTPQDFAPGQTLISNGVRFYLLPSNTVPMSIMRSSGTHVNGQVLVVRQGTVDINLNQATKSFSFWYTNAGKGLTVRFFAPDGSKIDEFIEPAHGAGEKAFGRTIQRSFTKVSIEVPGDNVLIDKLEFV